MSNVFSHWGSGGLPTTSYHGMSASPPRNLTSSSSPQHSVRGRSTSLEGVSSNPLPYGSQQPVMQQQFQGGVQGGLPLDPLPPVEFNDLQEDVRSAIPSNAPIYVLLNEMKQNAKEAEKLLWELGHQLKEKTIEAQRLRDGVNQAAVRVVEQDQHSILNAPPDEQTQKQIADLYDRIALTEREIERDGVDKLRLLKKIDQHVHGHLSPSVADSFAFTTLRRSHASTGFANLVKALPRSNVDLLNEDNYFVFCRALIISCVAQIKRHREVNVEGAALSAIHHAGYKASLVKIVSTIDEEDLMKL